MNESDLIEKARGMLREAKEVRLSELLKIETALSALEGLCVPATRSSAGGPAEPVETQEGAAPKAPTEAFCGCWRCLEKRDERTPEGYPVRDTYMVTCAKCGNKRCPHGTDHNFVCTNSNEPGQPGSRYTITAVAALGSVPLPEPPLLPARAQPEAAPQDIQGTGDGLDLPPFLDRNKVRT